MKNEESDEEKRLRGSEARLLSTAGFAARSGKILFGTNQICDALRRGTQMLVLEACDTSENTAKRLFDRCSYYRTPHHRLSFTDGEALAHSFGKKGQMAAVGITDPGIISALGKYLPGGKKS